MKTETRKVYQCDHCGKWMLSAGAMGYHEKWCKNPKNKHKCLALSSLEKSGSNMYTRNWVWVFKNRCKDVFISTWKTELMQHTDRIPQNMERMPLECNSVWRDDVWRAGETFNYFWWWIWIMKKKKSLGNSKKKCGPVFSPFKERYADEGNVRC